MKTGVFESIVEEAAFDWLGGLGYTVLPGPIIAPGELTAERGDYGEVVLVRRLRATVDRVTNNDAYLPAICDALLPQLPGGAVAADVDGA